MSMIMLMVNDGVKTILANLGGWNENSMYVSPDNMVLPRDW